MNDSGHWKGKDHALDPIRDSLGFVAAGIDQWLHDGWGHSRPAGHRHRRGGDSSDSGTKIIVDIWTLTGKGEALTNSSLEKVLQPTISPQTYEQEATMKESTKDQAEGKFHEVKGKIKEVAGKLSDNPELEAQGKGEKLAGKVQDKIGKVEKVVEK
jgi:uncharacterized protein YjbJ (UPF0337 family)